LIWDESFIKAVEAAETEARQLNAPAYGSEHILLGLLAAPDGLTERVLADHPELTVEAFRQATTEAVDDAPHLQRLGIDLDLVRQAEQATPPGRQVALQNRHTAELQVALNDATDKMWHLVKLKQLPAPTKVGGSSLWLAVLEPGTRAHRLLHALDIDPDHLRVAVLAAMAAPGSPPPTWPTHVRRGLFDRLFSRFFERLAIAS